MPALGSKAHMFARPYRRDELTRCFAKVLGCAPVVSITHPAIPQPMLLVSFPKVSQAIWTAIQAAITGTASVSSALQTAQGTVSGIPKVSS